MAVAPEATRARAAGVESAVAEELFEQHSGWVYGYCLRLLRSHEEAEDALQTTYLNAYRSLSQGTRPRQGSAWLLQIAHNVCLTRIRSSGRRSRVESAQDLAVFEDAVAAPDRRHEDLVGLTDALLAMPEQQRKAVLLREWQGLTYAEIAEELDVTQSAVETLIFRGRRALAGELENPGRRRLRSLVVADLGGILAAIKGFLAGGAGVKAVAAIAVATATTATVVATNPARTVRDRQPDRRPAPVVATQAPGAARASTPARPSEIAPPPPVADQPAAKDGKPNAADPQPTAGQEPASAPPPAESEPDGNGNPGAGGRAEAPGQAKKAGQPAKGKAKGKDQGKAAEQEPGAPAKSTGPPPHAKANGLEKHDTDEASA